MVDDPEDSNTLDLIEEVIDEDKNATSEAENGTNEAENKKAKLKLNK